jgi:hypothetical protein
MDVSTVPGVAPRPRDTAASPPHTGRDAGPGEGGHQITRRDAEQAATAPPARAHAPVLPGHDPPEVDLNPAEIPVANQPPGEPGDDPEGPSSVLKFDLAAADVLARFAIDERTKRVTVTMFNRDTGEVIREVPPRPVMDVMDVLAGRGLAVDVLT